MRASAERSGLLDLSSLRPLAEFHGGETFFAYAGLFFRGHLVLLAMGLLHPLLLGQVPSTAAIWCCCICLNSPGSQLVCESVGAQFYGTWSPRHCLTHWQWNRQLLYRYLCFRFKFLLQWLASLLSKGIKESKGAWNHILIHGEFSITATLSPLLLFSFIFRHARSQRTRVRFKFLVFSASSPVKRKGSCILSAYSIFSLRSSLEAEPKPSSRRQSIYSNICFM